MKRNLVSDRKIWWLSIQSFWGWIFYNFCNTLGLMNIKYLGPLFTRFNHYSQANKLIKGELDHVFISIGLAEIYSSLYAKVLPLLMSDHSLIFINLQGNKHTNHIFSVDECWTHYPSFKEMIHSQWSTNNSFDGILFIILKQSYSVEKCCYDEWR